jgi:adenylate cyclase
MATEIERKFLLRNDGWRAEADEGQVIRQGYLAGSEKSSIRVRVADDKANLNIKSATLDVTRQEYEYEIPIAEANELLDTLCEGPLIEKTRYHVHHANHLWEVDVLMRAW